MEYAVSKKQTSMMPRRPPLNRLLSCRICCCLAKPSTKGHAFLGLGLRSPRQLAFDGGQVEADDPLAAYLDDRHAHLAGLLLDRAGCRRVALDVYLLLKLLP